MSGSTESMNSLRVHNDIMNIHPVVQLSNILISSPGVRDDCCPRQHMISDNVLQCWCISTCNNLHPTSAAIAFNQADNPLTNASLALVMLSVEKVAFIHFHENRLAICIESSQQFSGCQ